MQTEIEAKWLNIDIDSMREKLTGVRAVLVVPERLMTRAPFDFPDFSLEKNMVGSVKRKGK